jgi:predicted metal-dependent enzyme (double-stranded beta helix superfamily)
MERPFELSQLIADLRAASQRDDASVDIQAILQRALCEPEKFQQALPVFADNDTILHEDERISIWHCRFDPGYTVPAHDHQLTAVIGIYSGAEKNEMYGRQADGSLALEQVVTLTPGDVLRISPNDIHAVSCASAEPCCGIHVYTGRLTTVDRSLFDVRRGEEMTFTDENYQRLTR